MNLLFTTHQGGTAGSTFSIFYLARGLAERGHRVFVGCKTDSMLFELLQDAQVPCIPMTFNGKLDFRNMRQIKEAVTKHKIQIVNVQSSKDRYTVGFSKMIYKFPASIVHTRRQIPKSSGLFIQNWFYQKTADVIVAVSEGVKHALVELGLPAAMIEVIHNGTPREKYSSTDQSRVREIRKLHGLSKEDFVIGCVSRRKKQEQLIKALPYLPENVKVVFVGIESDPILDQLLREQGCAKQVVFAGTIGREDILNYHLAMDVEVLPSTMEGLSQSLLEAMALGRPVIATNAAGNPSLIRHLDNGILFQDGDINGLADAIRQLMTDDKLSIRLAATAKMTALEDFEISTVIDNYERLFERLVQKQKKANRGS